MVDKAVAVMSELRVYYATYCYDYVILASSREEACALLQAELPEWESGLTPDSHMLLDYGPAVKPGIVSKTREQLL